MTTTPQKKTKCRACGMEFLAHMFPLKFDETSRRHFVTCPNCGKQVSVRRSKHEYARMEHEGRR